MLRDVLLVALCLSTTTVVLTAQVLHAMTKVLFSGSYSCACGQVGFLLPPEQATAVDVYLLFDPSLWLPNGLSDLANNPEVAMIRI
jgi:hypothetical protein